MCSALRVKSPAEVKDSPPPGRSWRSSGHPKTSCPKDDTEIDVEDVLGPVGVGLTAAALYLIGLVWMLLFLGALLTGLAVWIGLTRRRRVPSTGSGG